MKYYKYIKIILILIPVIILAVLVYKDICPSGQIEVEYDLCQDSPFFSKLSPVGRVLGIEKHKKYCDQKMIIDPVYFDVRLPHSFETAELKVWYQKSSPETVLKIGPRLNPQDWSWALQDINYLKPDDQDNTWSIGTSSFDLTQTQLDRNRLRFLISSPNLDTSDQHVKFKNIQIKFTKPPFTWNNLVTRLKNYLKKFF